MFLVTTAIKQTFDKSNKMLFLGEWCFLYDYKDEYLSLDYVTLKYHWSDEKKIEKDFLYLENIYNEYLKLLTQNLNKIHGIKMSERYWKIIIGPWLRYFVDIVFDRYSSLKLASKTYKITNTCILISENENLTPHSMLDFNQKCSEDFWNHHIFSVIIKNIKIPYFEKKYISIERKKEKKKESYFKALYIKIESIFIKLNKKIYIKASYFDTISLIKLYFKIRQFPILFGPKIDFMSDQKFDKNIRSEIKFQKSNSEFKNILNQLIIDQIPLSYIENFSDILLFNKKHYPEKINKILTANSYAFDDPFKIWAANKTQEGSKLIISQHGGNIGSAFLAHYEDHQINISDTYLSWGWSKINFNNIFPLPSSKLINITDKINFNINGKISWILVEERRYMNHSFSLPFSSNVLNYIDNQKLLFENLSLEVKDNLKIRYPHAEWGWSIKNRLVDIGVDSSSSNEEYYNSLNNSKLVICTYNATTLLETMSANIPTIIFWNPKFNRLRKEAKPFFDLLHKNEILFYDPVKCAEKINSIHLNPSEWWNSAEIQIVVNTYLNKFASKDNNWLNQWATFLNK